MPLTNRFNRALRPRLEVSVPGTASTERVSSEDSRFRRREVREAAYLRPCSLREGGNTPCSVAFVDLPSFDVLRGTVLKSREALPPSVGLMGILGVPGWDCSSGSSDSQGISFITGTGQDSEGVHDIESRATHI